MENDVRGEMICWWGRIVVVRQDEIGHRMCGQILHGANSPTAAVGLHPCSAFVIGPQCLLWGQRREREPVQTSCLSGDQ